MYVVGGKERLRNVTYLMDKFLMAKIDPSSVVSHKVKVYKKISSMSDEDLLHLDW
jgi:hypothetical protein